MLNKHLLLFELKISYLGLRLLRAVGPQRLDRNNVAEGRNLCVSGRLTRFVGHVRYICNSYNKDLTGRCTV
jgi:hypothetical protein